MDGDVSSMGDDGYARSEDGRAGARGSPARVPYAIDDGADIWPIRFLPIGFELRFGRHRSEHALRGSCHSTIGGPRDSKTEVFVERTDSGHAVS